MQISSKRTEESFKFTRDIIWVGFSQILVTFLNFISVPALTKSYPVDTYGLWAQINATVSLVSIVITLELGIACVRFLSAKEDKEERRLFLGTMLTAICIFSCFVILIINLVPTQVSVLIFTKPDYLSFVNLTFLWTIADALFIFFIAYLRARGKIRQLSLFKIFYSLCKVAVIIILALIQSSFLFIIISLVLVDFIFAFLLFLMIIREDGFPKPGFYKIRMLLGFSVPQIPGDILVWIISTSDRYFITYFLGLSYTGTYYTSNMLGGMVSLLTNPISFVLLPFVSKAWDQDRKLDVKKYFENSLKLFLLLALPFVAGVSVLSQPILNIFTTSDYLVGWEVVLLVGIGNIFLGIYQINLYAIYLLKATKWIPVLAVVASFTSVIINIILIPKMGIIGSAIANVLSYFILSVIIILWAKSKINYKFNYKFLGKITIASMIMFLVLYLLNFKNITGIILSLFLGIAVYFLFLLLLKAFSLQEINFVKHFVVSLIPKNVRFK